jgi:hypothetical protein
LLLALPLQAIPALATCGNYGDELPTLAGPVLCQLQNEYGAQYTAIQLKSKRPCPEPWQLLQTSLLACNCIEVMERAAMRSAKVSDAILLPHSNAMELRRGNRRATHVSTIIHL